MNRTKSARDSEAEHEPAASRFERVANKHRAYREEAEECESAHVSARRGGAYGRDPWLPLGYR